MSTSAVTPNKQELLFLGKECHHPSCHLHDFLPFSCPACHLPFCQPHFLPSTHSCTAPLPPSMVDRIAPKCPLCDEVVQSNGRDPNEAVERHIMGGTCPGIEGGEARRKEELKRRKERGEVCWRKGCVKGIVVPMKCDTCGHIFCPTHRHATSHSCNNASPSSSRGPTPQPQAMPSRPAGKAAMSRLLPSTMQSPSKPIATASTKKPTPPSAISPKPITASTASPMDARAAAAKAALSRAGHDVKVPFVKSKTDKRAEAETQSAIQALKARHDKGLLSKAEEVRYADLVGKQEAARRKGGSAGGKDGCVIA